MYPFPKNKEQSVNGTTLMLNWLEDTLSLNQGAKFMTMMHIWPGYNYFNGMELFWQEVYTNQYL